jgi:serine/threonine protein kinase
MAAEGMVHLDVKPANIVMGIPPRLIDLSVARSLDRAARMSGPIGTDPYMAPEQCRPRGDVGPPADVWGLGATAWWALTGSGPFPRARDARDSDDPAVRFPQLHDDPQPLPARLPPGVAAVLEQMLAKDPSERPTAAQVVEQLEPVVAKLPRRLTLAKRGAIVR